MAVSKRLRYEILRRDQHTCHYCGASAPDVKLTVDHVAPVALGGTDTADNLVTSCEPCNSGKSSASPDAHHVAGVADDALRWADAMKQAADNLRQQETPRLEYRDAFLAEWNRWHLGKDSTKKVPLPDDWKQSVERFRVAGVPTWLWADIVDAAMANQKVKPENTFRYICGIAWNKVTALQAEARRIVGAQASPVTTDHVVEAAMEVWLNERSGKAGDDMASQFRASLAELHDREDAHRVLQAAQYAAWFGETDATAALRAADQEDALQQWTFAWLTATGDYPDEARTRSMQAQINTLLEADVYVGRVSRAAAYAGSRRVKYLHFGLSDAEQQLIGMHGYFIRTLEIWAEAFQATSGRRPELSEQNAFLKAMERVGQDGDFLVADVHHAAAAAGAYQDPDITTCLTRHLSAFESAARPTGGDN
ncbi:HNH endonuclease [Streptomyces nodosus]|uniref:HNH endonuclease n=1 Tax=Streptomyces nodosus TaxID=40318 RepID=UPI0036E46C68